jgi:outer membrane biosynthesis protein TonB
MSTAEVTFSVGELATERKQEARKIVWALLAALLIHLIVGYVLAILNSTRAVPVEEEDKPVELTIVDTTPVAPPKPKNSMFMETDPSRQTADAPKEKTFESNANSIAASEAPPTGEIPLPSQEGKDRPGLELDNHAYSLANQGAPAQAAAPPQPTAAPQSTARPQETATPAQVATPIPTPAADQLALLTKRPTPQPQTSTTPQPAAKAAPQQPASAYRPERQKTRIGGNISNRGISSVNALGTPLGRYQKIVTDAIGSRWYAYTQSRLDLINVGTLTVHFYVDRSGKIKNLKVIANTSNEAFANVCLQSILDANLPPIPDDVAATLPSEGLEWDGINFIMYPN